MTYHVYDLPPPDLSGLVMEEARVLPAARDLVHLGQDGEVAGSAALQQLQTFERFSSQAPMMVGGEGWRRLFPCPLHSDTCMQRVLSHQPDF